MMWEKLLMGDCLPSQACPLPASGPASLGYPLLSSGLGPLGWC